MKDVIQDVIILALFILMIIRYRREGFISKGNIKSKKYRDTKGYWDRGLIGKVLHDHGYMKTEDGNWNIYHPGSRSYNDFDHRSSLKEDTVIAIVPNSLLIESKYQLWNTLRSYYGRERAAKIMPEVFELPKDIKVFRKKHRTGNYYLLKKDVGMQLGIKMTQNINDVINHEKLGYHSAQRFIHDALTFRDRKLNFRIYLLIVCGNGKKRAYMYANDGIMIYGIQKYSKGITRDSAISQGQRPELLSLYDNGHPILMSEYFKKAKNRDVIMTGARKRFIQLLNACGDRICHTNIPSFRLYGADFLFTSSYYPYLLELNGRPAMVPHTADGDGIVRYKMIKGAFSLLGFIEGENDGFVEIWRN